MFKDRRAVGNEVVRRPAQRFEEMWHQARKDLCEARVGDQISGFVNDERAETLVGPLTGLAVLALTLTLSPFHVV
ncbi:MAG: hypothetical protein L3K17_03380 [Thermoplasmata archaeon]|nr:hypothetical protein [Thermoplasmata archaeon]